MKADGCLSYCAKLELDRFHCAKKKHFNIALTNQSINQKFGFNKFYKSSNCSLPKIVYPFP